ncbi:proton-conducting transporter membrane subunit [Dasania marina]|uniref:proton-conducting transporter transmembrane domain-containing protein n=1 Tax=Dasania marina TaxID=471499 RepID=UPI000361EE2F|nr:proton-conducting transporter membrane subunit [Dasania marina]
MLISIVAPQYLLLLPVIVPVAAALLIAASNKQANLREACTVVSAIVLIFCVASLYPLLENHRANSLNLILAEPIPGIALALNVEPLGLLFAGLASFLWLVTACYSIGYMRGLNEQHQTRFYFFIALAIASTMGIALSANMFSLFIFYELLTLSTFPLITHKGNAKAKRAGRLYLGFLMGGSIALLLPAIIWTWSLAGTLDFKAGGILTGKASSTSLCVLFVLYMFGVTKAALLPLHQWLPAAMVAPTPVSALLHAVAVVKAGVFTILKISVYIFGPDLLNQLSITQWLIYIAAGTVFWGALMACRQDNLKLRLAYSTISQLSYIIVGALLANAWGIVGAGLHLVTHAFGKITLFFCAGAILVASGKQKVSEMHGLGRQMPFTMMAFFLASLSIIGFPPFGGLWSKWLLLQGSLAFEQWLFVIVLAIASLLSVAYLLPISIHAFITPAAKEMPAQKPAVKEAPVSCLIAIAISVSACFYLFFYPDSITNLLTVLIGKPL